jgi:hypothetical protein
MASANGTRIPLNASSITDGAAAVWTFGTGTTPTIIILRNGVQAAGAEGAQILWAGSVLYIQGDDLNWYSWNGSAFIFVGANDPAPIRTGTGAIAVAGPAISASGKPGTTGTGALAFTGPAISATGTDGTTGTGVVAVSGPAISGTGTLAVTITGAGAVVISGPALSGTGTFIARVTGTGALAIGGPTITAAGSVTGPVAAPSVYVTVPLEMRRRAVPAEGRFVTVPAEGRRFLVVPA